MLGGAVSPVTVSSKGCSVPPVSLGGLYQQSLASSDSAFLVLQLPSASQTQTPGTACKGSTGTPSGLPHPSPE